MAMALQSIFKYVQAALALLAWSVASQAENLNDGNSWITLGCLGNWGGVANNWLEMVMCPMAALEIRKHYDTTIRTDYGEPIIQIQNLNPNLRVNANIGNTGGSGKWGMDYALKTFQGLTKDGFTYDVINGLVGTSSSSVTTPIAALAVQFDIPMISGIATSPALSSKDKYPTFFRTCPPDTVQGLALFGLIMSLKIPSAIVPYTMEPYGQGLFEVIRSSADGNNQGQRVKGLGVNRHENTPPTAEYIEDQVIKMLNLNARVLIFAMNWDEISNYYTYLTQNSLLSTPGTPGFQLLGADTFASATVADLPEGTMYTFPKSKGPMWDAFMQNMWPKLTVDAITGTNAEARYELDRIPADIPILGATQDAWFDAPCPSAYAPYIFDAFFTIIIATNDALNAGEAIGDIKGTTLMKYMKAVNFEGVSGPVSFNENQDRVANIDLYNLHVDGQEQGRRLAGGGTKRFVNLMSYSATDGSVQTVDGVEMVWMTLEKGFEFPPSLGSCDEGSYQDAAGDQPTLMCLKCPAGKVSLGGSAQSCDDCPAGKTANAELGATKCDTCPAGRFSAESKTTECTLCPAGSFSAAANATKCTLCLVGTYSIVAGRTDCDDCSAGKKNPDLYATMEKVTIRFTDAGQPVEEWAVMQGASNQSMCGCEKGSWNANNECETCGEGMECPGMNEVYTEQGYFAFPSDPASIFMCYGDWKRCPGGTVGTCAANRDPSSVACSLCLAGYTPKGMDGPCEECDGSSTVSVIATLLIVIGLLVVIYYVISKQNPAAKNMSLMLVGITASQMLTLFQQLAAMGSVMLEWDSPFAEVLAVFEIFTFKLDILQVGCTVEMGPVGALALRTFLVLGVFIVMFITHCVFTVVKFNSDFHSRWPQLIMAEGTVFSAFFISIVSSMLSAFQCQGNPNGISTLRSYPSVTCWEDDPLYDSPHTDMVIISVIGSLLPVAFVSTTFWALMELPKKLAAGNAAFLRAFGFLFFRFRPGCQWYVLCFFARNLTVALLPVFLNPVVQILVMKVVVLPTLIITVLVRPWVLTIANEVDCWVSVFISFMLIVFALFCQETKDNPALSSLNVALVVFAVLLPVYVVSSALHRAFFRKVKPNAYYLSLNRAKSVCFGRALQMSLKDTTEKIVYFDWTGQKDMNELLAAISGDSDMVVSVCARGYFHNPVNIGELCTTRIKNIRTVKIMMPGMDWPSDDFVAKLQDNMQDTTLLARYGIGFDVAQETIRWMKTQPTIKHPDMLNGDTMKDLTAKICVTSLPMEATIEAKPNMPPSATCRFVIIVDADSTESCAVGLVLRRLVSTSLGGESAVSVVDNPDHLTPSINQAMLVCSHGCLQAKNVQRMILKLAVSKASIFPVTPDASFLVPSQYQLDIMAQENSQIDVDGKSYTNRFYAEVMSYIFAHHEHEVAPGQVDSSMEARCKMMTKKVLEGRSPIPLEPTEFECAGKEAAKVPARLVKV